MTLKKQLFKTYQQILKKLFPNYITPSERVFRFYKQHDGTWYVDLPEWKLPRRHLRMVDGADDFLESFRPANANQVYLKVSLKEFQDALSIQKLEDDPYGDGATYWYDTPQGPETMWLCHVTDWYYGYMPDRFFVKQLV